MYYGIRLEKNRSKKKNNELYKYVQNFNFQYAMESSIKNNGHYFVFIGGSFFTGTEYLEPGRLYQLWFEAQSGFKYEIKRSGNRRSQSERK